MEQNAHWSIAILQNQSAAFWTLKVFQGSTGVCRCDWCSELLLLCVSVEPVWNRLTNFFRGTMCVGKMFIYKVMWYSHCFSVDSRQDSHLAANHMWLKTYINIKCHELCGNKWCLIFFVKWCPLQMWKADHFAWMDLSCSSKAQSTSYQRQQEPYKWPKTELDQAFWSSCFFFFLKHNGR